MNETKIYHISFFESVNGKKDYYFGSISAIFSCFTTEQVGVAASTLYNLKLNIGDEHRTKFCLIKKERLIRKSKEN
ncbi:hypothetical protein [Riemerella anatipestifer]|uniref:Uncharacterized protein n=1 Tax=Riemerella anatipestifer TaxID=34085 RepID=A0A1S7DQG4_RIEAN|nr:hypothetical protein [Riemerella anatipestifer]UXN81003.1 hypothetical protein [Phage vB_RanS_PJN03]AQY21346.1 hypothetical protein AB406_0387 [Riemerella anatipestifer]MBO4234082.1 hypothetical protein [Riemerella anatipestifer]MDD1539411.1 hypothetical protein [Riemerella anatipestifer]MRM83372.1 hypothetical protein [Riemerella anatipestifer]